MNAPYKLEIECTDANFFRVTVGDRWADKLTWDEMLGTVAALTIPSVGTCQQWLQTAEQHADRERRFAEMATRHQLENEANQ